MFLTLGTPWTVACQAPLSMGFPREEYWSRLPFPPPRGSFPPRDRIHVSCVSCIAGGFFIAEPLGKPIVQGKHKEMRNDTVGCALAGQEAVGKGTDVTLPLAACVP